MAEKNKIIVLSLLAAVVSGAAAVIFFLLVQTSFAAPVVLLPTAAGTYAGWLGTWADVDEYPAANDADYNTIATANATQTFAMQDLTRQGKIESVKITVRAQATSTPETIQLMFRTSTTDCFSTNQAVTGAWATYTYERTTTCGGASWTVNDVNNMEVGFKFTGSGGGWHLISQMYAEVTYKTELKKLVFHIAQRTADLTPGQQTNNDFSIYIADEVDEVKSAFVELKGVHVGSGSPTLTVSIDDINLNSGRQKGYAFPATSIPRPFKILYDTTVHMGQNSNPLKKISNPGTYEYQMNVQANNMTVSVLSEKLIIVYTQIVPPAPVTGAYPASGTLISSTFDTGVVDGASYNSLIWQGTLPANTKARLQLATANSDTGPWTFYGDQNGDGTCGTGEYYEPAPNAPAEITCRALHNNQRYFQYKIQLCSSLDCASGGSATPQADDVIVNWSP